MRIRGPPLRTGKGSGMSLQPIVVGILRLGEEKTKTKPFSGLLGRLSPQLTAGHWLSPAKSDRLLLPGTRGFEEGRR